MRARHGFGAGAPWVVVLLGAALAGCGGDSGVGTCRDDSDCGGSACVNGRCRALTGGDMAVAGPDLSTDGGGEPDLGTGARDMAGGGNKDGQAPTCQFNNDGVITAAEAPFIVGLGGLYVQNAAGSTVKVVVHAQNGGWDYSAAQGGDRKVFDELLGVGGTWWAASYPKATHAQKIDADKDYIGVYQATADSLLLLGVVSSAGGLTQTNLTYSTPIVVLKFPLKKGSNWTSESDVSGQAQGVFTFLHEKYVFNIDDRGTTKTPAGPFDTLHLQINYTQTSGFLTTQSHYQYLHLTECYGLVARVTSQSLEQSADFSTAAEYRRLSTP